MSEFQGFSDREIKSVQQKERGREPPTSAPPATQKHAYFSGPQRISNTRGGKQNSSSHPAPPPTDATGLPKAAYFVQHSPPCTTTTTTKADQTELKPTKEDTSVGKLDSQTADTTDHTSCTYTTEQLKEENGKGILPDLHIENQQTTEAKSNLELLQKQQKELEDENKKKKALVEQTLHERYAKSQLEVKTLQAVKVELDRLDSLLNRDVTILRNRIEEANRQYTVARKRYEAAETEFIAAKVELHRTSESKELLSEHLCTIIQQNEARKAEKLADLLKTLELENSALGSTLRGPESLSGPALFQKTPTPGMNIWPRERLGSKENSPSHKDSGLVGPLASGEAHTNIQEKSSELSDLGPTTHEKEKFNSSSFSGGPTLQSPSSDNAGLHAIDNPLQHIDGSDPGRDYSDTTFSKQSSEANS